MCSVLVELLNDITLTKEGCSPIKFDKGHLLRVSLKAKSCILVQDGSDGFSFTLKTSGQDIDWKYF